MPPIIIPIESPSDSAVKSWDTVIRKMEEAEQVSKRTKQAMRSAGAPGGGSGGGSFAQGPTPPPISDPSQALKHYRQFDDQRSMRMANQAQRMVNRSEPADLMQRIQKAAYSTRFGSGGGAMPLVGQTLDIVGLGKFAGPIGIATAAVSAFAEAIGYATGRLRDIGLSGGAMGGTPAGVESVRHAGRAIGLSPEESDAAAKSVRDALLNNPQARAEYARRFGSDKLPLAYGRGNQNAPEQMMNALQSTLLDSSLSESERRRQLQNYGLEPFMALNDLSPKDRAEALQNQVGPNANAVAREIARGARKSNNQQFVKDTASTAFMPGDGVGKDMPGGGLNFSDATPFGQLGRMWNMLGDIPDIGNLFGGKNGPDGNSKKEQSDKKLYDAMKDLSTALDKNTNAVMGGGSSQNRKLLPAAADSFAIEEYKDAMKKDKFKLGWLR